MLRPTKQYALISEYAFISDMRLITRKYGMYFGGLITVHGTLLMPFEHITN